MTSTLLPPECETFPNRRRWTVEECNRLRALGFLDEKYEILDGEVVIKVGQKPSHFLCITLLAHWLNAVFGDWFVRVQGPIGLAVPDGLYSEPEPDVAVTREPTTAYPDRHPGPADLLLVVEVADTSLRTDLLVKGKLYARAGIPEFWALDLTARRLLIHRDPRNGEYASVTEHAETETVSLLSRPEASIAISELLPPPEAV